MVTLVLGVGHQLYLHRERVFLPLGYLLGIGGSKRMASKGSYGPNSGQ